MRYNNNRYARVIYADKASVDQVNWYSNAEFSKVSQMLLVQHERYAFAIQVLSTILHLVKLP